jgi:hypothetical protein
MADTKLSALTEDTAPSVDDLMYLVNDPGGTPAPRRSTISNFWKTIGGLTAETAPALTDSVPLYDTSASTGDRVLLSALKDLLGAPGNLYGLETANNSTSDLDIAAGEARDDANTMQMVLPSLITKTEAAWAVGTGNGGLDSGSTYANSTWYYVYLIMRPDTGVVDALFSASATSPTLPTNYTKSRRIGSFLSTGAGAMEAFKQKGDLFEWSPDAKTDLDTTSPAATWTAVAMSVPRIAGVLCMGNITQRKNGSAADIFCGVNSGLASDPSNRFSGAFDIQNYMPDDIDQVQVPFILVVNSSGQIKYQSSTTATNRIVLKTKGWFDTRGR